MSDPMGAEEVLTTTRAVRRRLDFDRPVERDLLSDCVRVALQAPAASNRVLVRFVIVTDPALRAAIGTVYAVLRAIPGVGGLHRPRSVGR